MPIENIDKFVSDVRIMRAAQNVYFKKRRDKNAAPEEIWDAFHKAKDLEKIVDKQLEEPNPNEPSLF